MKITVLGIAAVVVGIAVVFVLVRLRAGDKGPAENRG